MKKDIHNIRDLFYRDDVSKGMYRFITSMQELKYFVRFTVDSDNRICSVFFCHEESIKEARSKPEAIIIDATYKTNSHKFAFINIVGTCNVSSITSKGREHLQSFGIAGVLVNNELESTYKWGLEQLKNAVWPTEEFGNPGVFITDNEKALRNAISAVFPLSGQLLCVLHLMKNVKTNVGSEFTPHIPEFGDVLHNQLCSKFNAIAYCKTEEDMHKAVSEMKIFLQTPGHCKNAGSKAIKYIDG